MNSSLKIAIADDEVEVLHYFATMLKKMGHEIVVCATDGQKLIDGCKAAPPDLVITDVRMDHVSGIEALQVLSEDRTLPAILISAHCRPEDLGEQTGLQILDFLSKPIKLSTLQASVEKAAALIQR